jgi:hypothetical protein
MRGRVRGAAQDVRFCQVMQRPHRDTLGADGIHEDNVSGVRSEGLQAEKVGAEVVNPAVREFARKLFDNPAANAIVASQWIA